MGFENEGRGVEAIQQGYALPIMGIKCCTSPKEGRESNTVYRFQEPKQAKPKR